MQSTSASDKSAIESILKRLVAYAKHPGMNGTPSNVLSASKHLVHMIFCLRNGSEWRVIDTETWWKPHQKKFDLTMEPALHAVYRQQLWHDNEVEAYSQVINGMRIVWDEIVSEVQVYESIKTQIDALMATDVFWLKPDDLEMVLYGSFLSAVVQDKNLVRHIYFSTVKRRAIREVENTKCFANLRMISVSNEESLKIKPINFKEHDKIGDLIHQIIRLLK